MTQVEWSHYLTTLVQKYTEDRNLNFVKTRAKIDKYCRENRIAPEEAWNYIISGIAPRINNKAIDDLIKVISKD